MRTLRLKRNNMARDRRERISYHREARHPSYNTGSEYHRRNTTATRAANRYERACPQCGRIFAPDPGRFCCSQYCETGYLRRMS